MKILKNGAGSDVTSACEKLLQLRKKRYELLCKKHMAYENGDGDVAVAADIAARECKLQIAAAEKSLMRAVAEFYKSQAASLPEKQKLYRDQVAELERQAALHLELSARTFEHIGAGHIAAKVREVLQPLYVTSAITPDAFQAFRGIGRNLADEHLKRNPLPKIAPLNEEIEMIRSLAGGGGVERAWRRVFNRAFAEAVPAAEQKKWHEAELRERAMDAHLENV